MIMVNTVSLKKNYQFRFVYNRGKSLANKHLVLFVIKNKTEENKLGISISKKVGNSVARNRIRRLIKESYRSFETEVKCGIDIVVIARAPAYNAEYKEINKSLKDLFFKHRLLEFKQATVGAAFERPSMAGD